METRTTPSVKAPRAATEQVQPTLTVVYHPDPTRIGAQRALVEGSQLLLGRAPTCALPGLFEADSEVSRNHAKVVVSADDVVVTDLDSRNGTWLNNVRVDRAPIRAGDLLAVGRAVLLMHDARLRYKRPEHPQILGLSAELADVIDQIGTVAPHPTTVTIIGETGVGKELVAESIHAASGRRGKLVAINCAGVADTLLTSELFGHVRGAFTGADRARRGLVEAAKGGTLFLDEITDASMDFQASLLRLLETSLYRPVGSDREQEADVRYVVAVQPRVLKRIEDGAFRLDLWTRLARWEIEVPALRERRSDVGLLAGAFAERYAKRPIRLHPDLVVALSRHDWPGNVRELQGVVERLVLDAGPDAEVLLRTPWLERKLGESVVLATRPEAEPAEPSKSKGRRRRTPRPEREQLVDLMRATEGNIRSAAKQLGVVRKTLYRWLEAYGIDPDAFRAG